MPLKYIPGPWELVTFHDIFGVLIPETVDGRTGISFITLENDGRIVRMADAHCAMPSEFFEDAIPDNRRLNEKQSIALHNIRQILRAFAKI